MSEKIENALMFKTNLEDKIKDKLTDKGLSNVRVSTDFQDFPKTYTVVKVSIMDFSPEQTPLYELNGEKEFIKGTAIVEIKNAVRRTQSNGIELDRMNAKTRSLFLAHKMAENFPLSFMAPYAMETMLAPGRQDDEEMDENDKSAHSELEFSFVFSINPDVFV